MDVILKYFPMLSERQKEQFAALMPIYEDWNSKINVISRKDMEFFYQHHVLHSLAIANIFTPLVGARILDVGTGGGFPGIPLAILFPQAQFHLVDSIGKKIKVVNDVIQQLELANCTAEQVRAEQVAGKYDFVVSRAVTSFDVFYEWVKSKFKSTHNHPLQNGIVYLKGGDLDAELASFMKRAQIWNISQFYSEPFFETKKIVYLPIP